MRYFENFQVGDTFVLGSLKVTEEDIIAFAKQFDPQPFHIDPERARDSIFGGLVASGCHILSLFMRLFYDGVLHETASIGSPGVAPTSESSILAVHCSTRPAMWS